MTGDPATPPVPPVTYEVPFQDRVTSTDDPCPHPFSRRKYASYKGADTEHPLFLCPEGSVFSFFTPPKTIRNSVAFLSLPRFSHPFSYCCVCVPSPLSCGYGLFFPAPKVFYVTVINDVHSSGTQPHVLPAFFYNRYRLFPSIIAGFH